MLFRLRLHVFVSVWLSSLYSIEAFVSINSREVVSGGSCDQHALDRQTKVLRSTKPNDRWSSYGSSCVSARPTQMLASANGGDGVLSLSLEKPLGLILEENETGAGGVVVIDVNDGGSASTCGFSAQLPQACIASVQGIDVSTSSFDEVMEAIGDAPSPVEIMFTLPISSNAGEEADEGATSSNEGEEADEGVEQFGMGTPVTITVLQDGKPDIKITAKVGDNLRKTLLFDKNVALYNGLKKKLGNCGGGGQCGFCAVEFVEGQGWSERSEYEAKKIGTGGGKESQRLACFNNIPGPATIRTL